MFTRAGLHSLTPTNAGKQSAPYPRKCLKKRHITRFVDVLWQLARACYLQAFAMAQKGYQSSERHGRSEPPRYTSMYTATTQAVATDQPARMSEG